MLDKRTGIILKAIAKMVEGEEFVILKIEEIIASLPFKCDIDNITATIKFLGKQEFLGIKYYDTQNICLTVLPTGRLYLEKQNANLKHRVKNLKKALFWGIGLFLIATAGTIAGNLILKLIESFI